MVQPFTTENDDKPVMLWPYLHDGGSNPVYREIVARWMLEAALRKHPVAVTRQIEELVLHGTIPNQITPVGLLEGLRRP